MYTFVVESTSGQIDDHTDFVTFTSSCRPLALCLSLLCHSEAPCAGDAAREGTEELHDLPGALKTRMLLEYSTYMTQLIGPQSCNPAPSPYSDTGSPTAHKKVNEQHFNVFLRGSIRYSFHCRDVNSL